MTTPKARSYLRFSSDPQKWGDSEHRQLEASRAYAKAHGLELLEDDQHQFFDRGVSAYRGKHAKGGDLKRYLDLVREGRIARGEYFLIENLDRLSRQEPLEAFDL